MPQLVLALLGPFAATLDGQPVTTFESVKVRALLAYLAVEAEQPHSRAELAELLWPELSNDTARTYLRHALGKLREAISDYTAEPPYLIATRDTVQFNRASDHALDVASFTTLLAACDAHQHRHAETCRSCARRRTEALAYYRGDFLSQLLLRDSAEFEAWATLKRERLCQSFLDATTKLARYYVRRGDDATAQQYLERQVEHDPWDEAARRQLMTSLCRSGQRSAALAHYLQCRQVLEQDLGVEPEEATTALFTQIRDGTRRPAQDDGGTGARDTLPSPTASFVGRVDELEQLVELLQQPDCRLVTLTGPGGIGKTRLALAVAAELQDDFADGTWFVDLAPISDARLVVATIARALGVRESGGQPLLDSLTTVLGNRQALLVLDNFEHLLDAAPVVSALLVTAPQLTVLVTSREVLRLSGEHVYAVLPLPVPDPHNLPDLDALVQNPAVVLFVQRATAARASFQLTGETAPAVAELCARLDGLPLAIELVAARCRVLRPEAILARLEHRLQLLTGGARDLPARHQTMRATIDWSYRLLDAVEQRLFVWLVIFVGGWTLEAAEAVWSAAGDQEFDVLDGLQSLVDKSLVQHLDDVPGAFRFTMLETVRAFAREQLDQAGTLPGVEEAIYHAYATYYLRLAETAEVELIGAREVEWHDRLEREHNNVRAVLRWGLRPLSTPEQGEIALRLAGAVAWFWRRRGYLSEGRQWLEALLGRYPTAPAAVRAKALRGEGRLALDQNDVARGTALFEESRGLCEQLGDPVGLAWALDNLAYAARSQGDYVRAVSLLEQSLTLFRAAGDQRGIATSLFNLSWAARDQGNVAQAVALARESIPLFQAVGDTGGLAWAHFGLALAAENQGDVAHAAEQFEESIALFRELRDKWGLAWALHQLALITRSGGNDRRAAALDDESLTLFRQLDATTGIADVLVELARAAHVHGDEARASELYQEILALGQALGDVWELAAALEGLAGVAAATGHAAHAARLFGAAEARRDALGVPRSLGASSSYDQDLAVVHTHLDAATFLNAWAEGRAMTLEHAIAHALQRSD